MDDGCRTCYDVNAVLQRHFEWLKWLPSTAIEFIRDLLWCNPEQRVSVSDAIARSAMILGDVISTRPMTGYVKFDINNVSSVGSGGRCVVCDVSTTLREIKAALAAAFGDPYVTAVSTPLLC